MKEVLEKNTKDVPFVICYTVENDPEEGVLLTRQMTIGVPPDHPSAPATLHTSLPSRPPRLKHNNGLSSPTLSAMSALSATSRLHHCDDRRAWPIAKAIATRQCVVMDNCQGILDGYPVRQWDDLPESAIVIPFCSEMSSSTPHAVMILGLNLQCPLDENFEGWIHILRAHLTSSLASVRAIEAEQQRLLQNERMARAQTAWFQGAAHELRSPLTLVAGPLDDVLRTQLTPAQKHSLTLAQRNVSRIQRLVNSLLDFSRIEAGKLVAHFVPIDLGKFTYDLATLFWPAVERRGIQLDIDVGGGMATPTPSGVSTPMINVSVDPTLFETVVTNLISNAVKYTVAGRIGVSLSYTAQHVDIAISDTGCGIPSAELEQVTDRFHRATTTLNRGIEGTGIGLALSKEIVKLHDGELLIESQTEEKSGGPHGSTFTIRIPLMDRGTDISSSNTAQFGMYGKQLVAEAMYYRASNRSESESSVQKTEGTDEAERSEGLMFEEGDTLLLVDDNEDIRTYIRRIFSPYCTILEATNGIEGLEIARREKPNLILSDLMMPKMNGQELLAAIRTDPTTRHIPFVLLSAATDEELRLTALIDYSAEDFMLKPFKPRELLARVHLHMQLGKRRAFLESQFAQREQEMKLLSDHCPSGIVRADGNGKLIYANSTWRSYMGMPAGDDINSWPDYVEPITRARILAVWHELLRGDESAQMEVTWRWMNGTTVTGRFIRVDRVNGGKKGVMGCLQDISYQEEKLLEAERRRIEAEESKRQQEMLVDMTSHEIRTPVSAILQCSSLVKDNLVVLRDQLVKSGTKGFVADMGILDELDQDIEALESESDSGL